MGKRGSQRQSSSIELKICGRHACWAAFRHRPNSIIKVYITDETKGEFGKVLKYCAQSKLAYHIVGEDEIARVSGSTHNEGVCFLVREEGASSLDSILSAALGAKQMPVLLFLEGVENPHNFGAIARVAAHFGVQGIVLEEQNPLTLSSAAYRVAEGGLESVPVARVADLGAAVGKLRRLGYRVASTIVDGKADLFQSKLDGPLVLLLGAEGAGLSSRAKKLADIHLTIPGSGAVESLNVACATSVLLGEIWRQQKSQ